jgi:AraC family transcriptional activator of pobA
VIKKHLNSQDAKNGIIDLDMRSKQEAGFEIYRLEGVFPGVSSIVLQSRQTLYWITLVTRGSGEKSIRLYDFPIKDNKLFTVPRRIIHPGKDDSVTCSGYLLSFNLDFFKNSAFPIRHVVDRKIFKYTARPYLYLNEDQLSSLSGIFEFIYREHVYEKVKNTELIAIKVLELLIRFDRLFINAELIGSEILEHSTIEQFKELLEMNYRTERRVKFYAQLLKIHPNHLNFLMKKHSGMNAKESIVNRVIQEAKFLLVNSKHPVKDIASKTGFDDANNFSTFFQRYAGCSPGIFRVQKISAAAATNINDT